MTKSRLERIRETLLHAEPGTFTGGGARSLKRRPTVRPSGSRINTTRMGEHVEQIADVINSLDPDEVAYLVERLEARAG
ncbi:MAG: hypothetical protein OXI75_06950 [Rhodospirillales bacterium]|nr:hypothetical protein [Rhodospirillales bacterium]